MANLIGIWILLQGMCVAAGWTLSLLGQVNAMGYLVFFVLTGAALAIWRKPWQPGWGVGGLRMKHLPWKRYVRRFRHAFPLLFLLAALGTFVGGALYPPNNYDALSYRLPRILMWWAHSGWYWITTQNPRMNFSGVNFEWLMMPLLVWTHSDRFFFLINLAGYFLMPGLLFSILVEAGVAARVAWAWMWLLPMGFCYFTEAGSIGNDTIAASYILAAVYFSFRARKTGRVKYLALALLSAALATGVKASNIPMLLPIFFALWPALGLLRPRLVYGGAIILFCLVVSFAPLALLNQHYTGQWAGDPGNIYKQQVQSPIAGVIGNSLLLIAQAISPHIFPYARTIAEWVRNHIPTPIHDLLVRDFPLFSWQLGELPQEESGGLGLGISLLLGAALFSRWNIRAARERLMGRRPPGLMIGIMAWAALLAYMVKLGNEAASRLLSSYYPLLILPILLLRRSAQFVRRRWWRILGVVSGIGALLALVLTPSRPLWPAGRVCDWLVARYPHNLEFARAQTVYAVYRNRNSLLAPLRQHIPDTVPVFGLVGGADDADASLWQPYGTRQVRYLTKLDRDRPPDLAWVVIQQDSLEDQIGESMDAWLQKTGGVVVDRELITAKVSQKPAMWYVIHFQ
jgi:hypothetical protein